MFKFNTFYFIIAFSVGILACYIMNPKPKLVLKFPSPHNVGNIVYRDNTDNCFTFRADTVECTKDAVNQPIILPDNDN